MSVLTNRRATRWLVPAAAALAVIGGGAALGTLAATAEPSLPPRSAAQLLVDLQTARLDGLSGTVVQRADLGLPAIAGLAGGDLALLASGTHTLRVWYAGPDQARIAVLGTLGETDVIRNGRDLWIWSSQRNEARHQVLPADHDKPGQLPSGLPSTPQEAADQALAAIDPSTEVSVGRAATIAGRDAYELVLTPRDRQSLVDQVRIAIDAVEHVPLRFEVFAEGTNKPAIEIAFTQVDFARPDPEQFAFNPPAGAKVTDAPDRPRVERPDKTAPRHDPEVEAVGSGWTTVLVARAPQAGGGDHEPPTAMLAGLPRVSGDWGSGRLLSSKLFSALLTDDGGLLVGAVRPDRLYEVARQTR
jgi:outer membrane lipoprotein-sorting protein